MAADIPAIEMPFVSNLENCVIGTYFLTKSYDGLDLDEKSGQLIISNDMEIETTEIQVGVTVGT